MAGAVGRRVPPVRAGPPSVDDVPPRAGAVDAVAAPFEMGVAFAPGGDPRCPPSPRPDEAKLVALRLREPADVVLLWPRLLCVDLAERPRCRLLA